MLTKTKFFSVSILGLLILTPALIFSQQIRKNKNQFDYNVKEYSSKVKYNYDEIEGSPYVQEKFTPGYVYYSQNKKEKYQLRYNMYLDKFEMKSGNNIYVIRKDDKMNHIKYKGGDYKLIKYKTKEGKEYKGYLIELVKGNHSLYKRIKVRYKSAQEPTIGYKSYEPAKFDKLRDRYFLSSDSDIPKEIESFWRRKFLRLYFKDKKSEFLDYMRDKGINLRKEDELIQFFEYINN